MTGVSVLIPTRNRAKKLRDAVNSVLAQSQRPLEILISDNDSFDETPALMAIIESEKWAQVEIRTFRQNENIGLTDNHAFLLDQAKYPYCCFLHDDDLFTEPSFLSNGLNLMVNNSNIYVCVGNALVTGYNIPGLNAPLNVIKGSDYLMLKIPNIENDSNGWQLWEGNNFAFAIGGKAGAPSYSAIIFDREIAKLKGVFRPPLAIDLKLSKEYGILSDEALAYLYILIFGYRVAYWSKPVTTRVCHSEQLSLDPFTLKTVGASDFLVYTNLFINLIKEARVSPIIITAWYIRTLWAHLPIPIKDGKQVIWTLFRIRPIITVTWLIFQIIRRSPEALYRGVMWCFKKL